MNLNGICHKLGIVLLLSFITIGSFPVSKVKAVSVSAHNAILIEQHSGRVLFEKDAYSPERIASITKIMTAILAIESGKLDEKVKIDEQSVNIEGSSIYLQVGETFTLEELVYGLMLRSGNDAAIAIANYVGGSTEGFVHMMNERARELGMQQTSFANPHGLDDSEDHYSTANDMALLTKYAMQNDEFKTIFGTPKYEASNEGENWKRFWRNKNKLVMGLYSFSTGGKTGYTKRAKRTLVSTASKDGLDLIAVTLNAPDDWNDHISLFNYGFENYELMQISNQGKYNQVNDEFYKDKLFVKHKVYYPLTEEERDYLSSSLTLYKPPHEKDWEEENIPSPVGYLKIKLHEEEIASIPLYYKGDPAIKKGKFKRFFQNLFFMKHWFDVHD